MARGCSLELEIDRTSVEQFIPSPYSGVSGQNNLVHTMPWQVHVTIVKMTILS